MAFLGIDIGCISLKVALVGEADDRDLFTRCAAQAPDLFQAPRSGLAMAGQRPVLVTRYRRIKGSPSEATRALLGELFAVVAATPCRGCGSPARAAASSARPSTRPTKTSSKPSPGVSPDCTLTSSPSSRWAARRHKYLRLDTDDTTGRTASSTIDQRRLCGRHGLVHRPAGRAAEVRHRGRRADRPGGRAAAQVAGRCSVFAKSDMIHAQQKGYSPPRCCGGCAML